LEEVFDAEVDGSGGEITNDVGHVASPEGQDAFFSGYAIEAVSLNKIFTMPLY